MPEEKEAEWSFEAGMAELEEVVALLEAGQLPLEKAIDTFERGMNLSEKLHKELSAAETRVEMLVKRDGAMKPEPFDTAKP
jgi:exodeoxyribonuclease VII small subunit